MNKYKYYILTNDDTSEENVLLSASLDIAMEFMSNLFMEVHLEGRTNVERIELREELTGELIQAYDTHMEAINAKK